jgi:hypothetical protein
MSNRKRAEPKKAPEIFPPQSPVVFMPMTLSASVAFASSVDATQQRYRNRYGVHGAVVGGVLGSLIQREGLR